MKIAIIGGHLTPALATMSAIKARRSDIEFHFFVRLHTREGDSAISHEYSLLKEEGLQVYPITTGRLQRTFTRYTIPSLLKVPFGFFQSFNILYKMKPNVVVSFGGYLAVPIVIAARILKIRVVSHEQTLVPGLANQIISHFADVLALSFEETKKYYPHSRTVVTGNPIRNEIFTPKHNFNLVKQGLPVLYITGGNQGSHKINQVVFKALPRLLSRMHVIHQTGNSVSIPDFLEARQYADGYKGKYPGSYTVFDYIGPEIIGDVLACSDVVVSRAGVNTLTELLALGKKAILIPIPKTSHNEQEINAQFWGKMNLGTYLAQSDLNPDSLFSNCIRLLDSSPSPDIVAKAKSIIRLDAADRLAGIILSEL